MTRSYEPVRAYIGLGSNLQDPAAQVRRALQALARLPRSSCSAVSALYRSRALELHPGDRAQPDYVNAVARLETRLPALELLRRLQAIEAEQGRVRLHRWGPRTLDLDLLLYGDRILEEPDLRVPHPQLAQRDFVLYPLYEIEPDLLIPGVGALRDCLQRCPPRGLQRMEGAREAAAS